ncbi:hypothetical protein J6590_065974 [Homalodisca vitripennis]|nr:hypothetical protein J6590_065974 [Homalodisca vitripennis]
MEENLIVVPGQVEDTRESVVKHFCAESSEKGNGEFLQYDKRIDQGGVDGKILNIPNSCGAFMREALPVNCTEPNGIINLDDLDSDGTH